MNSLSYLSRQFDALAAARTPPSTPTTEHGQFISEKHTRSRRATGSESSSPLPRVQTWSTKSFLFSSRPTGSPTKPRPARSVSSPAGFIPPASSQRPQPISSTSSDSLALETPPTPTVARLDTTILHQTFLVRVLMLAWNTLRAAWASLTGRTGFGRSREVALEAGSSLEKDSSDDETSDEQSPSLSTPPAPSNSNHPLYMSTIRSPPQDAPVPYDVQADPHLHSRNATTTPSTLVPGTEVVTPSRSSTPTTSATRRAPFHLPKTLVLDLDETLIHSTSRSLLTSSNTGFFGLGSKQSSGHMVEVVLGGHSTLYHVHKRPFVDFFLRTVSGWYTLVIFTASMQEYADPVIDWLDAGRGILAQRFFRDSCTQLPNGSYTKDLSVVEPDLSRICLIDNSPISYRVNEANGIPIEGWTHDPSDEALLDLLPFLDSLRFTSDVRRVLGLRTAGGSS